MTDGENIKKIIRDIPDFPSPGILFRDITPVLQDPQTLRDVSAQMVECAKKESPDIVVGIESRGFLFGVPIALELGISFVPVRKEGKLPADTERIEYALEYGTNVMEIHKDAIKPGDKAVIVDDLLATGGTAKAAADLIKKLGGEVVGMCFFIELGFLNGRDVLSDYEVDTLVTY